MKMRKSLKLRLKDSALLKIILFKSGNESIADFTGEDDEIMKNSEILVEK